VVPHAGIRYAVLRLLMFVTVGGILYVIGLRSWLLLFAAVLLSGIASWFVFMRQREAAARNLEASVEHWSAKRHSHEQEPASSIDQVDQPAAAPDREPAEG
jgi:cytoskeletal protein RodZ